MDRLNQILKLSGVWCIRIIVTKGGQVESDLKAKYCIRIIATKGGQVESDLKAKWCMVY